MSFNTTKFYALQFGRMSDLKLEYDYITPDYKNSITSTDSVRDLGVIISVNGGYTEHISKICSKASQRIGIILRTFSNREPDFIR